MSKRTADIKNYFFPITKQTSFKREPGDADVKKNLTYYVSPVQFARIKHDMLMWRECVTEAEYAFYPQRVKMQRMFLDTSLNEHVAACMRRRKRLTLLRDFKICNDGGEDEDLNAKKYFEAEWFRNFTNHRLNAKFYGYSLISLGDVVNDAFPKLDVVKRHNVSPDRLNVTSYVYSLDGLNFMEEPFRDWHIWVPTTTETGIGKCGYGLFYEIAKTEILLRNNTQFNSDFQEVFGQPIRVAHTTKTNEAERGALELSLANMGSQAYIVLDDGQDKIELVESKNSGTAFQSYGDFEKRNEQKISKVILGHADAMSSIPGKLGSSQGGEESPVNIALDDLQVEDGIDCETTINNELIPRMRNLGFKIPLDKHFEYVNNKEDEEFRRKEDESNEKTATIAYTMAQAGLKMDAKYFQERTGIPTTDAPAPTSGGDPDPGKDSKLNDNIKNKLKKLYKAR